MDNTSVELKSPPRFSTDTEWRPTAVTLDTATYVTLLVRANVTDPVLLPPGLEQGAGWLARIREIETDCIARHGEFDWEKLPEAVRDEYDDLCALLDQVQDTGERFSLDTYLASRMEKR